MILNQILKDVEIKFKKNYKENLQIKDVEYDSRKVEEDSIFVCIEGYKSDGHKYANDAIRKGACAVVAQKEITVPENIALIVVKDTRKALALISANFFDYPTKKLKLIGVTGTNGKTTTTYLIKNILETAGQKVGLIGTNQNMIGKEVIPTERTTPESYELQKLFNQMVEENVDTAVIEVSSHSLDLHRVEGCKFDVCIFTNITQDHLDFHKNMDNYLYAKTKLFKMCEKGVINIDDSYSEYVIENANCEILTFGIDNNANFYAQNIDIGSKGVSFSLKYKEKTENFYLGIPGKFSIYNALGSIGACMYLGIDIDTIKKGIKSAQGVPGRAQVVETGLDFTVIIDYAHTPDGLENILSTVKGYAKGKVITVFGCGGDRDSTKRPIMGEMAGKLSDFCVVTSDNPRSEDPNKIIEDILPGINNTKCKYVVIENRYKAIEYSIKNANKDDVIVLAGKGHETYQEINGIKRDFNEEEIVKRIANKHLQ